VEIALGRGHEVVIHAAGTHPHFVIAPVPVSEPAPSWGLPATLTLPTMSAPRAHLFAITLEKPT
jgi:hypothetical protein